MLVAQHSELVDEGLWAAGGDVLAQQLPGHLVVVADDHGDAAGVEPHLAAVERDGACAVRSGRPDQLAVSGDEPARGRHEHAVGLRDAEVGANDREAAGTRREV